MDNSSGLIDKFFIVVCPETGTTAKELKPFLKKLEQNNKIKFDGTKYTT